MRKLLIALFLTVSLPAWGSNTVILGGDAIGSDPNATNGTGGFSAVLDGTANIGQPAIEAVLNGRQKLTELRIILFGVSRPNDLRFDNFDYNVEFWLTDDYLADAAPAFSATLSSPVTLTVVDANTTVPDNNFCSYWVFCIAVTTIFYFSSYI